VNARRQSGLTNSRPPMHLTAAWRFGYGVEPSSSVPYSYVCRFSIELSSPGFFVSRFVTNQGDGEGWARATVRAVIQAPAVVLCRSAAEGNAAFRVIFRFEL
jgi:hypothetical protein